MTRRPFVRLAVIAAAATTAAAITVTGSAANAQNARPVRTVKGGILDQITLFVEKPPATAHVVIRPFSAKDEDLTEGEKGDQTKTLQADGPRMLADAFVAALKQGSPITDVRVDDGAGPVSDAIVVEGKFVELDPGSRAKRYLVGFGAGKSAVGVHGTITGPDGNTLAEFEQRRIGVAGAFGGDSLGKMASDARSIGEDIAKFLQTWAAGGKLK